MNLLFGGTIRFRGLGIGDYADVRRIDDDLVHQGGPLRHSCNKRRERSFPGCGCKLRKMSYSMATRQLTRTTKRTTPAKRNAPAKSASSKPKPSAAPAARQTQARRTGA